MSAPVSGGDAAVAAAAARVATLSRHLSCAGSAAGGTTHDAAAHASSRTGVAPPQPHDVVIVSAVRTPICKAKRGAFKNVTPDVLLRTCMTAACERAHIAPHDIQDVCIGNVLLPGAGAVVARLAQLTAGIPHTCPLSTVNRQCSSGLQAIMNIAAAIQAGTIDVGMAGGVESMSGSGMDEYVPDVDWEAVRRLQDAMDCTIPMGVTSDGVAKKYGVTRAEQDAYAVRSHARAAATAAAGGFDAEIVPVVVVADAEGGGEGTRVSRDDGIRPDTSLPSLARLRTAFTADGTTTAGNSSQTSDGAAVCILTRRSVAEARGLRIWGVIRSFAVVGVPPAEMGIGPAVAIPAALAHAGYALPDMDVIDINEAFASQTVYCLRALGLEQEWQRDTERVAPCGGAIAFGHPLGCTGARQVVTLCHYLARTGKSTGVVSMCIGTGMGAAVIVSSG